MKSKDAFSSYHPIVNFLYFAFVTAFSMTLMHPVALCISFLSALCCTVELGGKKSASFLFKFMLPMMFTAALINMLFSHKGVNIICYLPSGNPLTLESIMYGSAAAVMLASVLMWFDCYVKVMTTDKFVYLFGKIMPSLSLVLSMTLRFVPKFKTQMNTVKEARLCFCGGETGGFLNSIKETVTVFSIMMTWSLENAIETADSMKSRGYGLPGRTAFTVYKFDSRDKNTLLWIIFCGSYILCGAVAGGLYFRYYPSIRGVVTGPFTVSFYIAYVLLCLTPVIINRREERKWRSLRSKI